MEKINPPFRLYDFLAYLFPGIATLHALYINSYFNGSVFLQQAKSNNAVVNVILFLIGAYLIGLVLGYISREILRKLLWRVSNPRREYIMPQKSDSSPLGNELVEKLQQFVKDQFAIDAINADNAYRLCRAYVAENCSVAWERRQFVVGIRSMCANFIIPTLIYATSFLCLNHSLFGILTFLSIGLLASKVITLDQREWKEIYFAFIVHQMTKTKKQLSLSVVSDNDKFKYFKGKIG